MYTGQCPGPEPFLRSASVLTHTEKYTHAHVPTRILSSEATFELGLHVDIHYVGALKQKLPS